VIRSWRGRDGGRCTWPSTVVIGKKSGAQVLAPDLARQAGPCRTFSAGGAASASRIGHENVIDISDFGQSAEGYVYIAMEYLEGQDLARWCGQKARWRVGARAATS